MPRIKELKFQSGPFSTPLFLSSCPEDFSDNWISVLIGRNGSGKSVLLRSLAEFACGVNKVLSTNHPPMILGEPLPGVSKVIAVSGTPLDRFPRGSVPGFARKKPLKFDRMPYVYLGQRAPNGVVGAGQGERILAALLLRHARRLNDRRDQLDVALSRLQLAQRIGYRLTRSPLINEGRLKKHPLSEQALKGRLQQIQSESELPYSRLPFDDGSAEVSGFVEWALGKGWQRLLKAITTLNDRKIAFTVSPDEHDPGALPTITDWRCVLALGLAEVSGLTFQQRSNSIEGEQLSSGQWGWLLSLSGIALESEDNCLVLVDEPENSLHPEWQREFVGSLYAALTGRESCQVVVATHSPLIASGVEEGKGDVVRLQREEGDQGRICAKQAQSTFGWTASDVYEAYFGMHSTRAPDFLARADHALGLVRQGAGEHAVELAKLVPELQGEVATFPAHDPMRSVVGALTAEVERLSKRDPSAQ